MVPEAADAIPYFARKYGVTCSQCHVAPPKLNAYGQSFLARGYQMSEQRSRRTWPFALWLSGRAESVPGQTLSEETHSYLNRVEIISAGNAGATWLSYFVEWRPLSKEVRGNGTLRDRSGRFEDLFLTASGEHLELTIGQFRQLGQLDVSQRLGLSEPLLLSASLPGTGTGSSREKSLRAFSPAGRSPSVRLGWKRELGNNRRWTSSVALPVPGEFSIPLTDSARVEASNEIEWTAKGIFVESFMRQGLFSVGGHLFYDDGGRYLANAVVEGGQGAFHWVGMIGVARRAAAGGTTALFGQWSLQGEHVPHRFVALGGRVEDRATDGLKRAFLPYVNVHFPGTKYTVRFTIEQRLQQDRNSTVIEVGTIF